MRTTFRLDAQFRRILVGVCVALTVAACGGGGGTTTPTTSTTTPTATTGVEGIFLDASLSSFRYLLVEPDGQLWGIPSGLYSTLGLAFDVSTTAVKGNVAALNGAVSGTYKDIIGLTCSLIYTCKVSGLSSASQLSMSGTKSTTNGTIPGWSFTGAPEASYNTVSTPADIAGTWSMKAAMPSNFSATGSLVVSSSGAITVTNIGSCSFAGTLTPTGKGYFKFTASTVAGTCATNTTPAQITGVAFKTTSPTASVRQSVLHFMWHNSTQSQYFWAAGA
jgi:hypothetical protein